MAIAGGVAIAGHGAMELGTAAGNFIQSSDETQASPGSGESSQAAKSKPEAIVERIDKGGFKVQQNPKTGTQEGELYRLIQSGMKIKMQTVYAMINGDLALLSSQWELTGSAETLGGKTSEVARRGADGRWRYTLDNPWSV